MPVIYVKCAAPTPRHGGASGSLLVLPQATAGTQEQEVSAQEREGEKEERSCYEAKGEGAEGLARAVLLVVEGGSVN